MVDVHFNLINDEKKEIQGYLPERVEDLSTGYDVRNAGPDIELYPFQKVLIPLGFRTIIPNGWYFDLRPRSSTFHKKSIHSLYGTIDESYSNQWYFSCQYIPESHSLSSSLTKELSNFDKYKLIDHIYAILWNFNPITIERGDRIAQIILKQRFDFNSIKISDEVFDEMVKLRNDDRGLGGFGSTGDK